MLYDKDAVKRWRRRCHKEIDRLNGRVANDQFRAVGLVAMSVYAFGTDLDTLVALSGQSAPFVRNVLKRLRAQRVLKGQTLRVNWNDTDNISSIVSLGLDLLVATGEVVRPVDPVRSAALKGKTGRKRGGTNRPKVTIPTGAVFTPKVQPVPNQLYGLAAWERR